MTTQTANDEQQVRQLEHQSHQAFLQGDVKAIDRIIADDFIFTDPTGKFVTKADWMEDMTSGRVTYESIHQDDLQVRVYGDAAVTLGRITMKARSAQDGTFGGTFCYTCLYLRRDGRWQAVAEQATLLGQQ